MSKQLINFIEQNKSEIEEALRVNLPLTFLPAARSLNEALEYAVFPGGKRLRPVLTLLACDLVGASRRLGLTIACAVEFLHCSSLILDDLPSMDDALVRRNRAALHLVFGEGIAVLAAVALLNQSYALFARADENGGRRSVAESLVIEAARCVGTDGMIGGQAIDLETQTGDGDAEFLDCRDLKTAALMRLMMTAGAIACGADDECLSALTEFGECFGKAYQLNDDLTDNLDANLAIGKTTGQDIRHSRVTGVSALGETGARNLAESLIEQGAARLFAKFGERPETLMLRDAAYLTGSFKDNFAAKV